MLGDLHHTWLRGRVYNNEGVCQNCGQPRRYEVDSQGEPVRFKVIDGRRMVQYTCGCSNMTNMLLRSGDPARRALATPQLMFIDPPTSDVAEETNGSSD